MHLIYGKANENKKEAKHYSMKQSLQILNSWLVISATFLAKQYYLIYTNEFMRKRCGALY